MSLLFVNFSNSPKCLHRKAPIKFLPASFLVDQILILFNQITNSDWCYTTIPLPINSVLRTTLDDVLNHTIEAKLMICEARQILAFCANIWCGNFCAIIVLQKYKSCTICQQHIYFVVQVLYIYLQCRETVWQQFILKLLRNKLRLYFNTMITN